MQRSPLQIPPEIRKIAIQTRMTTELLRVHKRLLGALEEIPKLISEARTLSRDAKDQLSRVYSLPKGEKGDSVRGPQGFQGKEGEPGYTPVKGEDYFTPIDIEEIAQIAARYVKQGQDGRDGRDGRDASFNEEHMLREMLKRMRDTKTFSWKDIPGLENEIASYRNQLAGKQYGKDTWARGGGDTVTAGTDISITESGGKKVISYSGSGTGTNVYGEVVAGNTNTFTLANTPTAGTLRIYGIGQRLTETVDYSLAGAVITTVNPWSAGDILADYSHA